MVDDSISQEGMRQFQIARYIQVMREHEDLSDEEVLVRASMCVPPPKKFISQAEKNDYIKGLLSFHNERLMKVLDVPVVSNSEK